NVLGANILNAFQVLGLSAVIAGTLIIPEIMITLGIPLVLISTFMYYAITSYRKISRWEGALLVLFYLMFIGKSFGLF
ncbi:MAG: sodium:calcium antiporter, partial [Nanoarchaeota archaeon]|nr:sodium:calcium antiporter [Nanoarchaeota archaeon]